MSHTADTTSTAWIKSSYSGGEGGNCVEWAPSHIAAHDTVPVRDSKNPDGPALAFTPSAWTAFITAIRTGELPTA
ncbi:DUF397 domain-containing protein [Streptomyces sp. NBC_00448]|uniref:DUF397 domain-containing protein n=1 Tax=Streptomyces sp. NBC_00448 TaxID=2903652 RepID=UPI002E1D1314